MTTDDRGDLSAVNSAANQEYRGRTDAVVLSVIAPCFNEEGNIDQLTDRTLATFDKMGVSAELVLVDDGSGDETWARIQRRAEADPRVRGVRHASNRGMEEGWRSGSQASKGDLICIIDADLQNRPEDVAKLYKTYLRELPDIVQAVRHLNEGPKRYRLFSRGLNFLLNASFGTRLRDNKSGFLLCRREVFADILTHRFDYRYFQSFVGVAAHAKGYTTIEVDTDFDQRFSGASFLGQFPLKVSLRTACELVKYRVEVWMASPQPSVMGWACRLLFPTTRSAGFSLRGGSNAETATAEAVGSGLFAAGTAQGKL